MSHLKQQLVVAQQLFADTEIPTMPREVLQLVALFAKDEFPDLGDVQSLISENAALTAEVIKLANQKQFLSPRQSQVMSIRDAIDVIGLRRLKNLVISISYQMQSLGPGMEEISEFSILIARVASEIAFYVEDTSEDEAYLAGLFHNAGCLLFATKFANYNAVFQKSIAYSYRAPQLEKQNYQTSHTVAGILVAKKWQLDNLFNQVILMHHQVDLQKLENIKVRTLIAIVQMAIALVTQACYAKLSSEETQQMLASAQNELMLDEEIVEEILSALHSDL